MQKHNTTTHHNATQCITTKRNTSQHNLIQPNPTQPSSAQPSPTQPNPTQPNPIQPNPTQPKTALIAVAPGRSQAPRQYTRRKKRCTGKRKKRFTGKKEKTVHTCWAGNTAGPIVGEAPYPCGPGGGVPRGRRAACSGP